MSRRTVVHVVLLTILLACMELTAFPAAQVVHIKVADIDPMYFTLMTNFVLAGIVCWCWKRIFLKDWYFGFSKEGIRESFLPYMVPAIIATIVVAVAFGIGLYPLDHSPTLLRVVVEGFLYYIGVGIIEELYLRGLLQTLLEKCFGERKHAAMGAILMTSVLFGLGHIVGTAGQSMITIVCKTIWAMCLGIYFGSIYYCTRNLWVAIIVHSIIDLCGLPFCFTTRREYPSIALITCVVAFGFLAYYGIRMVMREERQKKKSS